MALPVAAWSKVHRAGFPAIGDSVTFTRSDGRKVLAEIVAYRADHSRVLLRFYEEGSPLTIDGAFAQVVACEHPGLFADNFAPPYKNKAAYEVWLNTTHLCRACGVRVPNREL